MTQDAQKVLFIGRIDLDIYKCITEDIVTDEVVITNNQIEHIKERHEDVLETILENKKEIIENPDYIIEDRRENTGLIVKKIESSDNIQMVLRICTSKDPKGYKNSIISSWKISEKRLQNYLRNKRILYKKH